MRERDRATAEATNLFKLDHAISNAIKRQRQGEFYFQTIIIIKTTPAIYIYMDGWMVLKMLQQRHF